MLADGFEAFELLVGRWAVGVDDGVDQAEDALPRLGGQAGHVDYGVGTGLDEGFDLIGVSADRLQSSGEGVETLAARRLGCGGDGDAKLGGGGFDGGVVFVFAALD